MCLVTLLWVWQLLTLTSRTYCRMFSGAQKLGTALGEQIKSKGYSTIVFDRSGRKYHGCVKAFADAMREQGLKF